MRSLCIGALLLTSLAVPARTAAAQAACSSTAPSLDPAFTRLVLLLGTSVVGSVVLCPYNGGVLKSFVQETMQGHLFHWDDGTIGFVSSKGTWTLKTDGTLIDPDGKPVVSNTAAPAPHPGAPSLDAHFGIAEGLRNPAVMSDLGGGWERVVLPWDQIQPDKAGDFSHLGQTLPRSTVQLEVDRGTTVAGLLQFTPSWAAADPTNGKRSVPKNLDLAFDDPNNYFAQYVYQTVKFYAGQIDEWIIWNEPEFQPSDPGAGGSYTWLGSDAQFAQLMKVAYLAAKKANPNAVVSFPGTSYWVEFNNGRVPFYDRILGILAQDPAASTNHLYHDAVSLNVYRNPDDIYRVYQVFKDIQAKHGIERPVWLTEMNAMPSNDASIPCAGNFSNAPIQTTLDQQAAFAIQALALGAAAGYERMEIYQMVDANPCDQPAVWGVTRDDGSRRPIADAFRVVSENFSGFQRARFEPITRTPASWPAWPDDPGSLVTNWQMYQVALDRPGNQRVTVLWNGDGSPLTARIPKHGSSAQMINRHGEAQPLQDKEGGWVVELPGATAHYPSDPDGYFFIGGDPVLIVEQGVDPGTPVVAPALETPGSRARDFDVFVDPQDGETVTAGSPADFFLSTRGYEGYGDPISFDVLRWSTQRFPEPKEGGSLPLALSMPPSVRPGDTATLHFETAGADPGIYYITVQATGGENRHLVNLALAVS
jgi:hypothetical protein